MQAGRTSGTCCRLPQHKVFYITAVWIVAVVVWIILLVLVIPMNLGVVPWDAGAYGLTEGQLSTPG